MSKRNRRRGRGEGGISYNEAKGLWVASLSFGVIDGKRVRKTLYAQTKEEILARLRVAQGKNLEDLNQATTTLAAYVSNWLEAQKHALSANSYESYDGTIRRHITPTLGAIQIGKLQPAHLRTYFDTQRAAGRSNTVLRTAKTILNQALTQACVDNLIQSNPVSLIRLRQDHQNTQADAAEAKDESEREVEFWTQEEALAFLREVVAHIFFPIFALALTTGMRFGEVLGLQWENILWDAGIIRVRKQLLETPKQGIIGIRDVKTKRGRRDITLTPEMLKTLRLHREAVIARGQGHLPQVFPNRKGGYLLKGTVRRVMERYAKRAGVRLIGFHDQRHTHATHLLQLGERIEMVSKRLGHARPSISSDIYTHVPDAMDAGAAEKTSKFLPLPSPEGE